MYLQENTVFDLLTLTLGSKVTINVNWYPLHHMAYSAVKFVVATANGLEEDAFIRKCFI